MLPFRVSETSQFIASTFTAMYLTMRIVYAVCFALLVLNCACGPTRQPGTIITDWKWIRLPMFEILVPDDFTYVKQQGIDSYVGEITNGRVSISFDYGWYTNPGPKTILDGWLRDRYRLPEFIFNDIVLKKSGEVFTRDNIQSIQLTKIETIDSLNNLLYIATYTDSIRTYVDTISTEKIKFMDNDYQEFNILYNFDGCSFRKYYKSKEGKPSSGVYTYNICTSKDNQDMLTTLGVFVDGYNLKEVQMIDEIIQSITLIE